MRGYASGPMLDKHFFIIMDRLYETLKDKIKDWEEDLYHNGRPGFLTKLLGIGKGAANNAAQINREHLEHDILLQRMIVAYDLSAAFCYMHENKYVGHLIYLNQEMFVNMCVV
jgi:hypothetical protein